MRALLVVTMLAGCNQILGIGTFELGDGGGRGDDGGGDSPDAAPLCGGTLASICVPGPTGPLDLQTDPFDTASDPRCTVVTQTTGPELCVVAGTSVTISGTTHVIGARPLVVIAASTLTIAGTLDASSVRVGPRIGAGADASQCLPGTPPTVAIAGGAGGSFGALGGNGGFQGTAGAIQSVMNVRGGCPSQMAQGPRPAHGGGAIYLIAGSTISIAGGVFASGEGGSGAAAGASAGSSGGGSGGLVALEAPTITVSGTVAANGGGGAGGSTAGLAGAPGGDGTTTAYSTRASGGVSGGAGGAGGALGTPTGANGGASIGGGGGGGGCGVVWVKGAISGSQISPAPTIQP
jgi:hypothetical protein